MIHRPTVALLGLATLLSAAPAVAQENKTLKFSHVFAASHWSYTDSIRKFEEAVAKATDGKIQFQTYHAGQIGKEGVNVLASGLAELALLVPSYEAAKLPLTSVSELPGMYTDSCEASAKLWHLVKDGGPLHAAEYKPQGIKPLYAVVLPPYQLMTSRKKVASLEELSGLKLRANGAAMDKSIRAVGGIPVRVTGPEFYDSLTRGTVDGGLWTTGATRLSGMEKLFKHITDGTALGSGSIVYAMRQQVFDALSPSEKEAFTKAGTEAQQHLCTYLTQLDATEKEWLIKNQGLVATPLTAKEKQRWLDRLKPVADAWAKDMDASGRPGSAMLKAFRDAPAH